MREGWEYSTIGALCDKFNGLWKGKKKPFVNVGVIRNANFTKEFTLSFDNIEYIDVEEKQYKTRKLIKGDLIVEKSGGSEKQPVGRTILFDKEGGEYSFSNFTSVIRIKDREVITPEFLYKYILYVYLRGDMKGMQKATTGIHNIEFEKYLAIPVPLISLSEQQEIVDYLDASFAKIDAMKANAEKALEEGKAFFQSALKQMLEPKEGWEEKKLVEELKLKSGDYLSAKMMQEGNIPVYGGNGIAGYHNNANTAGEQVLIGRVGALCGNVHYTNTDIWVTDNAFIVNGADFTWNKKFLAYELDYLNLNQYASQTAQPVISNKSMKDVNISKPPLSEQQTIVTTLDTLKSKVDQLQANYDKITKECDALKQAILRQVFE